MSARDSILSAIRAGLGGSRNDPAAIAAEAADLLAAPETIRPPLVAATLVDAFCEKSEALGATVDRIGSIDEVPASVGRYLEGQGLSAEIAVESAALFRDLDWGDLRPRLAVAPDAPAAVGLARHGIAESGSLVIHSGKETRILLAFLPLHHIVVLRAASIVSHLEDYAALLVGHETSPRNAVLITGPSGTTDIEGSYVRGAHGPGFVHVILVDDA